MTTAAVAVLGTGRVGLTLARALVLSGTSVRLLARSARPVPDGLPVAELDWSAALTAVELVLVAVPDDAIVDAAAALVRTGTIVGRHVVLHTSGLHHRAALDALESSGAALGSLHPLQSFSAPAGDAALLLGVPAIVEGDARAVAAARELAATLGMGTVIELPALGKVSYHAAAVVASNYLVVLADIAERLAREAGAGESAAMLFQPIMQQTLSNIADRGTVAALTGPVRRGDAGTVAAHLAVLHGDDRAAYVALAREALLLARRAGLPAAAATELEASFGTAATSTGGRAARPRRV